MDKNPLCPLFYLAVKYAQRMVSSGQRSELTNALTKHSIYAGLQRKATLSNGNSNLR